jgi:hypothetical protein
MKRGSGTSLFFRKKEGSSGQVGTTPDILAASFSNRVDISIVGHSRARDGSSLRASRDWETLDMPHDAKLGLVIGVSMVIALAAIFFRKEPEPGQPAATEEKSAEAGQKKPTVPPPRKRSRLVPARQTGRSVGGEEPKHHTIQEGDTLYNLALHYYGDGDRFVDIFRANRDVLKTPDQLPPGIELVIPETEEEEAAPDQSDP